MRGEPMPERGALLELRLRRPDDSEAYVLGRWKLVVKRPRPGPARAPGPPDEVHLFDLAEDPRELRDLADERPRIVQGLLERLDEEVAIAREVGRLFEGGAALELSEIELERLDALGYGGR